MNAALSRTCDIAINSVAQPVIIPDTLPPLIVKRWSQAMRVNNRADWRQMAELCGRTAIGIFCENGYDPHHADFRAICQLARIAHLRGVACLTHPRQECGTLA